MNFNTLLLPKPVCFSGHVFVCGALRTDEGLYQPVVVRRDGGEPRGLAQLPHDTHPCASVNEALRHAEQQALRWAHDRTGHGQGRF